MKRFLSFMICGGIAASVNFGSRWVLSHWVVYPVAIVIAYLLGMLTGFLLFKFFVFTNVKPKTALTKSKNTFRESFWYTIVNVLALLQTLCVSLFCTKFFFPYIGMSFYPYEVAHAIGVMIPVITSYFGHKYLTFR